MYTRPHVFDGPELEIDRRKRGRIEDMRIDERDVWAAIIDDLAEVGCLQQSVDRNGDGACGDRAPESNRQPSRIGRDERDAFVAAHTRVAQDAREASNRVIELAVGDRTFAVDDRRAAPAAFHRVTAEEPFRCIEGRGKTNGRTKVSRNADVMILNFVRFRGSLVWLLDRCCSDLRFP